jgi:carboxyl-terminal processing protease
MLMDKKVQLTRVYLAAIVLIVLLLGFVAGTRSKEIYGLVGPLVGVKVETGTLDDTSLQDLYQTLKTHYNGELSDKALIEGAKQGMAAAAGDPYTVYFTAKEAEQFNKELTGDIGAGIGAEIGVRNGQPTVLRTLEDHPAKKAGLHSGDIIIAVNDQNADGWTAEEAVKEIRGEKGTTVKIVVSRKDEVKEFAITRDIINNPSVSSELRGGVGIITINRFDEETVSLVRKAATKLKSSGMKKMVVDMRGNGGGYLDAAPGVAGMWLDDKLVVSVKANTGSEQKLISQGDALLKGVPTAVVVNGGSASATEIVAAALKYHEAAEIIGETTFGKGTVQELLPLEAGSMLKVTVKRWYTPAGKNFQGEGIKPDYAIKLTQKDVDAGRDPQLEKAIQVVNSR